MNTLTYRALVISGQNTELVTYQQEDISCLFVDNVADIPQAYQGFVADVALLGVQFLKDEDITRAISLCAELQLDVIAVVPEQELDRYDSKYTFQDFILFPFRYGELITRIKAAKCRNKGRAPSRVISVAGLTIDLDKYDVMLSGRRINLTYKEYQLLVLLASNPGKAYTRDVLLTEIWGYEYFGGTRTVDVHIRRLRSKLETSNKPLIETIWNVGYRLNA